MMPASLDMQKVTADVCAEMFGIVAELACELDRQPFGVANVVRDDFVVAIPVGLLRRARALNVKLLEAA